MNTRSRAVAFTLLVSSAVLGGAEVAGAAIEPPVRAFHARYVGTFAIVSTSIGAVQPTPTAPAPSLGARQEMRISASGLATSLGASSASGSLGLGTAAPCQKIKGNVTLTPGPIVTDPPPRTIVVALNGLLCSPVSGVMSFTGRFQTVSPAGAALSGPSGWFRGRAHGDSTGRLVLILDGRI